MGVNESAFLEHIRETIQSELDSIQDLQAEIDHLLEKAKNADQEEVVYFKRAAGSILHDFYTGVEKIFQEITKKIDGVPPQGERWHIELLESMAQAIDNRPVVITPDLKEKLEEYLGFRHLFRNIYASELKWEKMKFLLNRLQEEVWPTLGIQLKEFDNFLQEMIERLD